MINQTITPPVQTAADVDLTVGNNTVSIASCRPATLTRLDPNLFDTRTASVVRIAVDLPGELNAVVEVPTAALIALLATIESGE
ncbi:hypothetical protein SEA_KIKO_55 [Gordonia phage Kiko]|uniref:hypothetical protein n=1 Tax=Gordonia rubripertincta TaxID=36822 RepID=UPI000FDFA9D4|nr:hypothetical protein [Gordonia rubripertincta]AZV00777.1 hypothetical protein SEA_KIKO_55 [Gordonia phage Kiko]QMU22523.1 hypothetical protein H3V45_08670 [Gordonia rubripertincta]